MDWILVGAGLVLLIMGGDYLVRGAVALATKLGISALVVSLTVVAFGTSAPELLIAVQAAFDGVPELALGNVVGSNTANVLLVLGVPALISGLYMDRVNCNTSYIYMMMSTLLFIAICYTTPISAWQGIILLVALISTLLLTYREAMSSREKLAELEGEVEPEDMPNWKMTTYLIGGLVALPVGSKLLITGATNIATDFGVPQVVIGLTLVALGTSLPELATTVAAAARRQADVAIGNVVGSNMFNLLAIPGIAAFFGSMAVPGEFFTIDLWVMLACSIILFPFVFFKWNMTRLWGVGFILIYIAYVAVLLNQ